MESSAAPDAELGVLAGLRDINRIYSAMAGVPVASLSDARLREQMLAAVAAKAAADQMVARLAAEAEHSGTAHRDGATSTRAWAARQGLPPRDAARAVAQGNSMTAATETARLAWARGEICGDRAEAIATAVTDLPETADPTAVETAQADLVEQAKSLTVRQVRIRAKRLIDHVDPVNADRVRAERLAEQEQRADDSATLVIRKGSDRTARFSGTMPNLTADMLMANLDAISDPRRDHLHERADTDESERVPYEQRIGRAFCDLVESFQPSQLPRDHANATMVVTIPESDLRDRVAAAGLPSGDDISAGELRRIACGAGILPALGGDSQVLDLGTEKRLFTKAQRIALTVRDGGCVFPDCDRPPGWTEAHHVQHWSEDGPTDISNGALLCGHHHRLIHRTEDHGDQAWEIRIAEDGLPEITPPKRIDPKRTPFRNSANKPQPPRPTSRQAQPAKQGPNQSNSQQSRRRTNHGTVSLDAVSPAAL